MNASSLTAFRSSAILVCLSSRFFRAIASFSFGLRKYSPDASRRSIFEGCCAGGNGVYTFFVGFGLAAGAEVWAGAESIGRGIALGLAPSPAVLVLSRAAFFLAVFSEVFRCFFWNSVVSQP